MEISARTKVEEEENYLTTMEDVRRIMCSEDWLPNLAIAENFMRQSDIPVLLKLPPHSHDRHRQRVEGLFLPGAIGQWSDVIGEIADSLPKLGGQNVRSMGSDFARPLAASAACRFVGIRNHSPEAITNIVAPLFSQESVTDARQALCGFRLYRIIRQEFEAMSGCGGDPRCLLHELNEYPDDAIAVSLSMLTAGTEVTARAILACISEFAGSPRTANPMKISNSQIDHAISKSEILTYVNRVSTLREGDSAMKATVSLCPVQASGIHRELPFGFGRHFCLGATWVREVCRAAVASLFSRFDKITIDTVIDSGKKSNSVLIGGITDIELRLS